jgi:class 3 adenylate cyclase
VNLASRIEGLTKDARRRILVSRETRELFGEAVYFVVGGCDKV